LKNILSNGNNHPMKFDMEDLPMSLVEDAIKKGDYFSIINILSELNEPDKNKSFMLEIEIKLIYAIYVGNIKIIDITINEFNIDIRQYTNLLKAAVCENNIGAVRYLLDNGLDVNTDQGYPIRACCHFYDRNTDLLILLIDYRADIHIENNYPIKHAVQHNRSSYIKILLDANADIHANR
jgi:hypothetical protein